jgi:23S rRNA (cytosine1962-C5)-methyltransferase
VPCRVTLKRRRARPFFARHPWVFESSIERVEGQPAAGQEVDVVSHEGQFVARGLFNPSSAIRARLYRWDQQGPLDETFWSGLIAAAARLRHQVLGQGAPGSAYRLVSSEGDGLSGLSVDCYDRWMVAQFTSLALFSRRELFLRLLMEAVQAEGAIVRTDRGIAQKEGLPSGQESSIGSLPEAPVAILENGLSYKVDLRGGQKTGFYLDQRQNRLAAAAYCRGRSVLDLFCFTGGFALNALRGGASAALGVDSSGKAIELARQHAAMNALSNAQFEEGDVLDVLNRLRTEGKRFGVVICDPPKFARQSGDVERALKGYLRLNLAALEVLESDGVLVTCSCSGLVGRELFAEVISSAAERSGRTIQILEQRGQAPDHPISASCLETEYLKCMICRAGGW